MSMAMRLCCFAVFLLGGDGFFGLSTAYHVSNLCQTLSCNATCFLDEEEIFANGCMMCSPCHRTLRCSAL